MDQEHKPVPPKSVTGRALSVLGAFDVQHPELTLTELAKRTGLALATAYRLAGDLEKEQYLVRDGEGMYRLGTRLWEMGVLTPLHGRLRESAMPFLLNLQYDCRETVQLAIREGTDGIYVEKLTLETSVPVQSRIGARIPLHATGIGKSLLAFAPEGFLEAFLQLPMAAYSETTITNPHELARELRVIRRQGFSESNQEYHAGSTSIAAPVVVDGVAVAAVGIVNYELRDDLRIYKDRLLEMTNGLAARLQESKGIAYPALTGINGAGD